MTCRFQLVNEGDSKQEANLKRFGKLVRIVFMVISWTVFAYEDMKTRCCISLTKNCRRFHI